MKLLRSLDEESRVPWATIYLVIAILWGLVLVVVTPPFQAFDEHAHYSRAWSVAQGEIDPGEDGQVTLPANVAALPATFNYVDVFRGGRKYDPSLVRQIIWQPISSETVEQPTSASGYGPLGYVPQVAGIEIVRVLGRSPLLGLYVGRVLNLLAAVIVTWFAIRLLPFAKPVIVFVALFPTTIFLSASLSPDALMLSSCLLFLCLVLRCALKPKLDWRQMAALGAATVVLLNVKPGYLALCLLLLLLRPSQVGGRLRYAAYLAGCGAAAFALNSLLLRIGPNGENAVDFSARMGVGVRSVDASAQLHFIVQHPWAFTKVVHWTLAEQGLGYVGGMFGSLGWGNVGVPQLALVLTWLGIAVCMSAVKPLPLGALRRITLGVVAPLVCLTVVLALYLAATAVAYPRVVGLQGRYFTPALAPLLLSVVGLPLASQSRTTKLVLVSASAIAVAALAVIFAFYY